MSRFGGDDMDWDAVMRVADRAPPAAAGASAASGLARSSQLAGAAGNGRPRIPPAGIAHPPPGRAPQPSSLSSVGFMGGGRPAGASSAVPPRPSGSSLPAEPHWMQGAYGAPASSPLATRNPSAASSVSPHFSSSSSSNSNSAAASRAPFSRAPTIPASRPAPPGSGARGQSWEKPRAIAFPSSFSQTNSSAAASSSSGWRGQPTAVGGFPSGFNPNASPAGVPDFQPPKGAANYRKGLPPQPPPPPSGVRYTNGTAGTMNQYQQYPTGRQNAPAPAKVAFYAMETDVPKGRKAPSKKKNDLGDPLPQHLQEFVHTAKHKLPGWLDPDERKLLRKERRRIKDAQKSSAKELVASKAEKERIDLDVYNHEQKRERGGWNANRIKVAFQLCSEDRVAVETQPRNHTTILHAIQSCEGAQFDRTLTSTDTSKGRKSDEGGRKGLWTVPLAAYDACLARCIGLRSDSMDVVIVPVDPKHLKALRGGDGGNKSMMKFESMQGIPKELATHLYPFQKVGVEFCVAHGGRALIGDEMGLGKTLQAISVAAFYQNDWPLLVVCPSSVRLTWRNELLKWLGVSSLQKNEVLELSSDEEVEADAMEGFIPDEPDEEEDEGEAVWNPKAKSSGAASAPMSLKDKFKADFIDNDEEFERVLAMSAEAAELRAAARDKDDFLDDGEAEWEAVPPELLAEDDDEDAPKKRKRGTAPSKKKSKKRRRIDSGSDDDEDAEVSESSVDEWNAEAEAKAAKKGAKVVGESEEEEETAESEVSEAEEEIVVKKTRGKRRRIIDDDEDEDGVEAASAAGSTAADPVMIPESDAEDDEVMIATTPPASSVKKETATSAPNSNASAGSAEKPVSAKEDFRQRMGQQLSLPGSGGKSAPAAAPTAPAARPIDPDREARELEESLRLIAEMEEREAKAAASGGVKMEVDGEGAAVKEESSVKVEAPAVYQSAAGLIKLEDNFGQGSSLVKHEPEPMAPSPSLAMKTVSPMPSASPSPVLPFSKPSSSPAPSSGSKSTAAASSSPFPGLTPPVRAPIRPSFRPLFKNEINVILNGKTPLMGHASSQTRVVIISYDLIQKYTLALQRQKFQFIICDESHYVKNATAKRSQALLPLLEQAKRVLCLSGTPAMSRPFELYPQINALCPGVFGTAAQFGQRYCAPTKGFRGVIEYKGAQNLVELHMLLKKYLLIRRLKSDVLKDLKPKMRTPILTTCHDRAMQEQLKGISNLKQLVGSEIETGEKKVAGAAGAAAASSNNQGGAKKAALMQLFADTGVLKLPFVISYISELIESGTKFLLFAHHLSVLDGVEEHLKKHKTGYFRLDGSTKPADRQAGVDRFQTDPTCQVALLSITAGGTGITLTASSTVVFAELQWTPALLRQAEDRVHRIGQFNSVNIYYIIAHHTLDDFLWPLLQAKLEVLGKSLDGVEDAFEMKEIVGDERAKAAIKFKMRAETVDLVDSDQEEKGEEKQLVVAPKPELGKTEPPKPIGQRNWIGMSGGAKPEAPAAAAAAAASSSYGSFMSSSKPAAPPAPLPSSSSPTQAARLPTSSPFLSSSAIKAAHASADLVRREEAQRDQQKLESMIKQEGVDDLARFRVPSPTKLKSNAVVIDDEEEAVDMTVDEDAPIVAKRQDAMEEDVPIVVAPPEDAVIPLADDSDAGYTSSEEEDEETGLSVRDALAQAKAKQQQQRTPSA